MIPYLLATLLVSQTQFPKSLELPPANGYSHVVVTQPGRMVFIAGQVAMDKSGKIVGTGDLKAQVEQALRNLKTALAAAGADFSHVVKINWYVKNFQASQLPMIREARNRYINTTNPPASTLVGVSELFVPEALVEVEAIAILPESK